MVLQTWTIYAETAVKYVTPTNIWIICQSPPPEPWFATAYSMVTKLVAAPLNSTL